MNLKNIDHINLTVANFEKTIAWYGQVFGFKLVEENIQDGVRWGVIRNKDVMLCIYEHPECQHEDRFVQLDKGLHRINHFGFRITDRKEWETIIERENLTVLYNGPISWPHSTSWYVTDPTGWEIEVALWKDDTIRFESD